MHQIFGCQHWNYRCLLYSNPSIDFVELAILVIGLYGHGAIESGSGTFSV